MMDLSIVIPLYNEDESIDELHSKIVSSLSNSSFNFGKVSKIISISFNYCIIIKKS